MTDLNRRIADMKKWFEDERHSCVDEAGQVHWLASPPWDSNISCAWDLVDEMGQDFRQIKRGKELWHSAVWTHGFGLYWVEATTITEAICHAYIAWREAKEKQ